MQRVLVVPHDPLWAGEFDRESQLLCLGIGDLLLAIHHIGSTAIPGIYAKPIIDMLAVVNDLAQLDQKSAALESLGYEVMGELGIPGRRYFRKNDSLGRRTHHVHAFQVGSPHIERHLAFRDFMRAHPMLADQYGDLKRKLAAAHPHDIEAYMDGKDGFIKAMQTRALEWLAASGGGPGSRSIRVIAICVFSDNGRILVAEGFDDVKRERFARPIGGAVEPGETSLHAVVREVREELGQNAIELQLLGVLENIFEYQGKPGHEVVFVYDGRLEDSSLYRMPALPLTEPGWSSPAKWRSLDSFGAGCRLVPEGLAAMLGRQAARISHTT